MTLLAALLLAKPLANLPFEHESGRIWLKATLNGKPLNVTLDTGATWSVVDDAIAFAAGAKKGEPIKVGANGPDQAGGWRIDGLSLALGGAPIPQPVPLAMPLSSSPLNEGYSRPIQAILGGDFLKRYVVEIDYVRSKLRLFKPESYRPPKGYTPFDVRFVGDRPTIKGTLTTILGPKGKTGVMVHRDIAILIDTGSGYGLDLTYAIVRGQKPEDLPPSDGSGTVGLGGEAKWSVLPWMLLMLGGMPFTGGARLMLTPEGASGADAGYEAIMGDGLMSHLDVVMDYSRSKIYLKPNGK